MAPRRRPNKSKKGGSDGPPGGGGGKRRGGGAATDGGDDDIDWSEFAPSASSASNDGIDDPSAPCPTVPGSSAASTASAALAFVLYVRAAAVCDFPYDDDRAVRKNPDVLDAAGDGIMSPFSQFWRNDFWGTPLDSPYTHKSYRPLVVWTLRWDASISSGSWIFHLTNAVLYAACAWLVAEVALPPALSKTGASDKDRWLALLLSGLWFASHPVHAESVAGIVGRAEVMAAMLCLLGSRLAYPFPRVQAGKERRPNLAGAAACLFAACLCKETSVVVPAMFASVDVLRAALAPSRGKDKRGGRGGTTATMTPASARFERAFALGAVSFAYLSFRQWLFAGSSTLAGKLLVEDSFMQHLRPLDKFRTALFIQAKYLQIMLLPGALSCDYGLGIINPVTSWISWEMGCVVLAALAVASWGWFGLLRLHRTGDPSLLLAAGWTFAPLVPASHIVDIGTVMAERLAFTPTVGVCILLCHLSGLAARHRPEVWRTLQVALGVVVVYFSVRTAQRVPQWADSNTLFEADAVSHPRGVKILHSASRKFVKDKPALGFEYAKRAQEVTDEYSDALINSPYSTGLLEMASLKVRTEKWPEGANLTEALEYVDRVLEIGMATSGGRDGWCRIYTTKATALFRMGRAKGKGQDHTLFAEAIKNFEIAAGYNDSGRQGRELYCEWATALAMSGLREKAREKFHECFEREAEEDLTLADFSNYALLMLELSGVDDKNALSAMRWGDEADRAITTLLDRPEMENMEAHVKEWKKTRSHINSLKRMGEEAKQAMQAKQKVHV